MLCFSTGSCRSAPDESDYNYSRKAQDMRGTRAQKVQDMKCTRVRNAQNLADSFSNAVTSRNFGLF